MIARKFRSVLAVMGVGLALVAQPLESQAFFHGGCGGWCGGRTTYRPYMATYAPVYAAPSCNPCNTCSPCAPACPTVCNYVPQTCYRPVCCQVPVTAYQPVTTCDPCTGCPRTTLRPVTTYVTQQRMVPYTSLRPVFSSPCATGGCGVSTVGYAPAMGYSPVAGGCSSCSASYAPPVTTYAPATPAPLSPAPSLSPAPMSPPTTYPVNPPAAQDPSAYTPAPSLNSPTLADPGTSTPDPTLSQPSGEPRTFKDDTNNNSTYNDNNNSTYNPLSPSTGGNLNLKPIPDPMLDNRKTNLQSPPRLLDPQDRHTSRPVQRSVNYQTISTDPPVISARDDGGWRSASR